MFLAKSTFGNVSNFNQPSLVDLRLNFGISYLSHIDNHVDILTAAL
jgi:hypothetical protein